MWCKIIYFLKITKAKNGWLDWKNRYKIAWPLMKSRSKLCDVIITWFLHDVTCDRRCDDVTATHASFVCVCCAFISLDFLHFCDLETKQLRAPFPLTLYPLPPSFPSLTPPYFPRSPIPFSMPLVYTHNSPAFFSINTLKLQVLYLNDKWRLFVVTNFTAFVLETSLSASISRVQVARS